MKTTVKFKLRTSRCKVGGGILTLMINGPMIGTYTPYGTAWASGGSEQIRSDSTRYYSRFITAPFVPYDWSANPTGRNVVLWYAWRVGNNDPCANITGSIDGGTNIWRIPNQDEWSSIWGGSRSSSNPSTTTAINTANTWVWRAAGTSTNNTTGTAAGYLIKPDGVTTTLFLPAAGSRNYDNGQLNRPGVFGSYWDATAYTDFYSYSLAFHSGTVRPTYSIRAYGYSVRCVGEL